MPLDMFTADRNESIAFATRESGPQLPATFSDGFSTAWNEAAYFGQSIAGQTARRSAIADFADEMYERIKDPRLHPAVVGGDVENLNRQIKIIAEETGQDLRPISDEEVEQRAIARSRESRLAREAFAKREQTWGSFFGSLAGGLAGGVSDPINMVALPVAAPTRLGVLGTALAWGGIGAGTQAAIEVAGAPFREEAQPGYVESAEPARNILMAGGFAGFLGGGVKGLGQLWGRVKTGAWPRSVRDAGNVAESEAQIAHSNPFAGADGEVAHRQALGKAIDDLLDDRPVEVDDLLENLTQSHDFVPLVDARSRAASALAQADAERPAFTGQGDLDFGMGVRTQEAQEHIGDMAFELQRMAQRAGQTLNRIDAERIAETLVRMPDNESATYLDEFLLRPTTIADVPPIFPKDAAESKALPAAERAALDEMAPSLTVAEQRKARLTPENDEAVATEVARMRAAGDVQVPIGETVAPDGTRTAVFRSADDIAAEYEARISAADEIAACARAVE
jgi:hypothetical protein